MISGTSMIEQLERVRKAEAVDVALDHEVRLIRCERALSWAKTAAIGAWATPVSLLLGGFGWLAAHNWHL